MSQDIRAALAFARSAILSGEQMTPTAEEMFGKAFDALDSLEAAAPQAQDAERLDWLEADIRAFGAIHLHDGNHPAGHGLGLHGRTLREVIDAVRQADAALQAKEQSNG